MKKDLALSFRLFYGVPAVVSFWILESFSLNFFALCMTLAISSSRFIRSSVKLVYSEIILPSASYSNHLIFLTSLLL